MNKEEKEDLMKKTKAEIIDYFSHLSEAVKSKDKDIAILNAKYQNEILSLNQRIEVLSKDNKNNDIAATIDRLKQQNDTLTKQVSDVTKIKNLVVLRERQLQTRINQVGNILKGIDSIIQTNIDLNEFYYTDETKKVV